MRDCVPRSRHLIRAALFTRDSEFFQKHRQRERFVAKQACELVPASSLRPGEHTPVYALVTAVQIAEQLRSAAR
jgi:hypothetical protein